MNGKAPPNGGGAQLGQTELALEVTAGSVREELERILAHALFNKSKRYAAFLRYVVGQALEGRADRLKEKTIGTEALGRSPEYDSDADPIVRVTAGELRKRLTEYYSEPAHASEIRIAIPPGSYLPQVRLPPGPIAAVSEEHRLSAPSEVSPPPDSIPPRLRVTKSAFFAGVVVLAGLALLLRSWAAPTALDRFWAPLADPQLPLNICLPHTGGALKVRAAGPISLAWADELSSAEIVIDSGSAEAVSRLERTLNERIAPTDAAALVRLVGYWASKGHRYEIRRGSSLTLADLAHGPALLLGAYNNEWTLRLRSQGRFRFAREGAVKYIADQQNPAKRDWSLDEPPMRRTNDMDYGLVSRVVEPSTGRIVLLAGGLGGAGTEACAEFLTDPKYMESITRQAPGGWDRKNVQVVVAVRVINGSGGQPQAVATHFW